MTEPFEYIAYSDEVRIAILENRTADLERRLRAVTAPGTAAGTAAGTAPGTAAGPGGAPEGADPVPAGGGPDSARAGEARAGGTGTGGTGTGGDCTGGTGTGGDCAGSDCAGSDCAGSDCAGSDCAGGGYPGPAYPPPGGHGAAAGGSGAAQRPDWRTEALISRGRQRARRSRLGWLRAHWRAAAAAAAVLGAVLIAVAVALPGGAAGWPSSVARMRSEIALACRNPNVAAEPSQLDFACGQDSRQILWVFALLTSGGNPGFADRTTGRAGLEPIQPAQGGDIAWSLNLHHPYDPANPIDSLQVAARAINNIIGGATLTSQSGAPDVQPGLEGSPANCRRYTGSARLATRPGFPPRCALPVTGEAGRAALVSDVFKQWMAGTPTQVADEAGVLFVNADNPGDPRVRAILATLPSSGG